MAAAGPRGRGPEEIGRLERSTTWDRFSRLRARTVPGTFAPSPTLDDRVHGIHQDVAGGRYRHGMARAEHTPEGPAGSGLEPTGSGRAGTPTCWRERLLDGLNGPQANAVASEAEPLCVLAGAGSGKTRVLTRRIAWRVATGSAEARHVLALTFTRKAAGELRHRLVRLGIRDQVASGTFHAVALAQLRRRWVDNGVRIPALVERKAALLVPVLRDLGLQAAPVAEVAREIEWAQARLVRPDAFVAAAAREGRRSPASHVEIAAAYRAYEREKGRRRVVDFDDLLLLCAEALEGDPGFAAAQRWRFRHLFVDEFQDVNPLQYRLLRGWLGASLDLCVVGDPNQSIYSWNGADPSLLHRMPELYPSAEVVKLDDNYRSSPQILAVAGAALGRQRGRPHLRAARPDGPVPTVCRYRSDHEETAGIARALRKAHRPGTSWSALAVLARTNAQLVLLSRQLRTASIPHRLMGGSALLERPEVRAALSSTAAGPSGFSTWLRDLQESVAEATANGEDPERLVNLQTLVGLANEYRCCDESPSLGALVSWLQIATRSDAPAAGEAVELSTFHRSKGLEWPVVFVTGLEQGLVPIGHASSPAAEAEERRLLYVAMTRAQTELHCSWAERRSFGDRSLLRAPSPYLDAVDAARSDLSGQDTRADLRSVVSRGRAALGSARVRRPAFGESSPAALSRHADPEVLESLRTWRAAAARAAGVPAFVIFHDSTLAALATALPATRKELGDIAGLGPVKLARYGDVLLSLVSEARASA